MRTGKTILVAPLNWGLGHATRCIPIIEALLERGHMPLIASDGMALELLRKEFPLLESIALPSYRITYAKNAKAFKWKLLLDSPTKLRAIVEEKRMVQKLVRDGRVQGILSDNRLGVRNATVPSVFITHQLNVLSGNTTWMSSKIHQEIIKKYDQCWVPDFPGKENLSGDLAHGSGLPPNTVYIGALSRLRKQPEKKRYDLMVLLSGPEPQRTMLENKLLTELQRLNQKILFVSGRVEARQKVRCVGNFTRYNFMDSGQLQTAINSSELILSRSGYTTVMDLSTLDKKAFFIPTPGQYEQEYLAKRLDRMKWVPTVSQDSFTAEHLLRCEHYSGFNGLSRNRVDWGSLFGLFEGK